MTSPRTLHYGEFYGLRPLEPDDGRPLVLVHGNCQAEALRVLLDGTPDRPYRTVRVPPVHELTADDVPHLDRLLAAVGVLVVQPVRDGYRDLPLGTREVVARAAARQVVAVPVVRLASLFPFQALVRVPGVTDPPVVPYHDLRTLVLAAGRGPLPEGAPADAYVEVARRSVAELRRREQLNGTLAASDLLLAAGAGAAHTVNHPGNPVLLGLARRVQEAAGWPVAAVDPGRVLLSSVVTPLRPDVLDALGLEPSAARDAWSVAGQRVEDDEVRDEQLRWYADRPEVVAAGLERHADVLAVLGL